ncbi:MAG: peptide chain release factor N(5)-glutamine methyltransferase [Candidatus Marinimicrobia bacterium]|jgi:release factor glutamine methyltransferase|nr:peptide chain release factor N(5)-glutamine methyltransferase [Candidatus Neomarinimicrobiota bacterium]MBT3683694.1 peptide chain release factor N(5)-glutamine methyltransferase [Candidatus Neomarinimicrobiota bacterium]MBT3760693.1 peptide chain release factor N(5)-glutamine methyltransferase [Candidatus Neomarinimicrobiota bacterium]MBT3896749.1 peptide chain release factor N(5)-glutamine methyltransferase [Candidatus Neomarinimicrobiota bacterium]MBT4173807.1 peptide chain release factor
MNENSGKTWRVIDLINWGADYFNSKSITNARREVEWLLCHVLNCERIDLYLEFEQPLFGKELSTFRAMVLRRVKGEPFQHIIGKAPFYGRDFIISPDVLIPRPETEIIIDILKEDIEKTSVLEIGTGSGCLAITIELEGICHQQIATDISKQALTVAKSNAEKFKVNGISFRCHDFLNMPITSRFDVIISNPPYISDHERHTLERTVIDYDPEIALTDYKDGFTFYRRFADQGHDLLNQDGYMLLEFGGDNQADNIEAIFTARNYQVKFYPDLQNNLRVVKVTTSK